MMPDNVALFAAIIVLLPMIYLLLAAPAFLLVKLDIKPVAQLLRAMFSGLAVVVACIPISLSRRREQVWRTAARAMLSPVRSL